jgi:hypothetical protein
MAVLHSDVEIFRNSSIARQTRLALLRARWRTLDVQAERIKQLKKRWVELGKDGVVMMRRDRESDAGEPKHRVYGTPTIGDGDQQLVGEDIGLEFALTIAGGLFRSRTAFFGPRAHAEIFIPLPAAVPTSSRIAGRARSSWYTIRWSIPLRVEP